MRPIVAQAVVRAPAELVWALLDDLRDHWLLADRWTEVLRVDADGGTILLRGPLGVRRTVDVRVTDRVAPTELQGLAVLDAKTAAQVRWTLEPIDATSTRVTLRATVQSAGWGDRLLLVLGAHRWLQWRFIVTLRRLNERVAEPEARTLFESRSRETL
jgi:hypothetical protein